MLINWEAVGALGQVLGSLIVVVSVIYLAIQIRQANQHAEATAEIAWMEGWNRVLEGWVTDLDTMRALRSGFREFNRSDKTDQAVFQMRVGGLVNQWILARRLADKKLMTRDISDMATDVIVSILRTSGGLQYWERDSEATPYGVELLQRARSEDNRLPAFTDIFPWWDEGVEQGQEAPASLPSAHETAI
jgi:AraC-like DNA-binding protein